jgi:hypothetical protein
MKQDDKTVSWTIEQTGDERILCRWHIPEGGNLMKREVAVLCDWNGAEDRVEDEDTLLLKLNGQKPDPSLDDPETWKGIGDLPPAAPECGDADAVVAARKDKDNVW